MLLAPLNPVDFNVIQGAYARSSKPQLDSEGRHVSVAGNEGLARVDAVGDGIKPEVLKVGDWGEHALHTGSSSVRLN